MKTWTVKCEGIGSGELLEVTAPVPPVAAKKWTFNDGEYVIVCIFPGGSYTATVATVDGNDSRLWDKVQPEAVAYWEKIKRGLKLCN